MNYRRRMNMGRRLTATLLMIMLLASTAVLLTSCGPKNKGITSMDQLNKPGIQIAVQAGTPESDVVEKEFPKAEIVNVTDIMSTYTSVAQGKIDAFVGNKLNMERALDSGLEGTRLMDGSLGEGNTSAAAVSPRTQIPDLKERINEFLSQIRKDGTLDDISERWIKKHDMVMPDIPEVKDPKYHLVVGTTGVSEPFTFFVEDEVVGYDIEIARRFASWLGASIEFKIYNYDGIVAAAQGGDVDCIFANLYITPERAQTIDFSDPTYTVEIGVMVKDTGSKAGETAGLKSLKESFEKTFIRENRWKLFAQGMLTTLVITMLSILFGTVIGFIVFLICRTGNRLANKVTRFSVWLIEGLPVVVLLMILYYIVFSESNLSGVVVSVIAFTLIFASAVFNMLNAGVAAVSIGQTEAAYSLGYTDNKAFFSIVLPQALPHVMPSYKSQIKALIKATAVVGYVAVEDLTKMGDIVRSRTYEAFFPLIAVAVFYFILTGLLLRIFNRIEKRYIAGDRLGKEDQNDV